MEKIGTVFLKNARYCLSIFGFAEWHLDLDFVVPQDINPGRMLSSHSVICGEPQNSDPFLKIFQSGTPS
jgi:hypothetical protein